MAIPNDTSANTFSNTSKSFATTIGNTVGNLLGTIINNNFNPVLKTPVLKTQFAPTQQEYIENNQKWINDWKKKQQQIQQQIQFDSVVGDDTPEDVENVFEQKYTNNSSLFDDNLIQENVDWDAVAKANGFANMEAVKQWQKNNGLVADGKFGDKTRTMQDWHKTMGNKGYRISKTKDGTYSYIDGSGNRYYNNGRMISKDGTMSDYDFNKLQKISLLVRKNGGNILKHYQGGTINKYQSGGFVPTSGYGFEQAIKDSQNNHNTNPDRDYFLYEGEKWTGPNGYTDVKQRGLLKGTWNFLGRYWDFLINGGHPGLYYRNFTDTNIKKSKIKPETDKPKKFQQGGNMANKEQEIQQAFMAFLIEDAAAQGLQIKTEEDLKAYAQQLGEEGLQAKYQEFMQKMQGGVKAKLGAKLNYMRKIKGLCPDGEEAYYFKEGGQVKRGCKCMEKGGVQPNSLDENPNKNAIEKFKERKKKNLQKPSKKSKYEQMHEEFKKRQPSQDSPLLGPGKEATEYAKKVLSNKCGNKVKKASGGETLGLKGKINKYNDPDPKNPQKVLYDNYGNSVINEKGYFIKRKDLPNNKFKDDTIKSNDPRYNKIKLEFNNQK